MKNTYIELWKHLMIGLLEGLLIGFDLKGSIECKIENPAIIE